MAVDAIVVLRALGIEHEPPRRDRVWAKCPYHSPDNKPSWSMRLDRFHYGLHHCFSCKEGGGIVGLVMHAKSLDVDQAKEWLKQFGGVDGKAPEEELAPGVEIEDGALVIPGRRPVFNMDRLAVFKPLAEWPAPPREYVEKRGVTADQVDRFRLGYSGAGRLGGRIVLPVLQRGRVVSYMARDFTGQSQRRYLYPRADENPQLDAVFGEHLWPRARRASDLRLVVTEGALNALAVERAVRAPDVYVAALGGTNVTEGAIARVSTFRDVVLLTDNDPAGNHAAAKIEDMLAGADARVVRGILPRGKDANDLDPEQLWRVVQTAMALSTSARSTPKSAGAP